jgi:glycosyltransferase involved in cell wall biosynthesis
MRIGIDARFFGPHEKGLGIYVKKLVESLEKNSDGEKHQFFVFLRKERFEEFQPNKKNFHKIEANFGWYSWQEQLLYPIFLNKYKLDVMHFTHFNAPIFYFKKNIITIHDLILFHFPTFRNSTLNKVYYLFKLLIYRLVIKINTRKAQKIIAISDFTKKDLVKTLKISENKIKTIYQGCDVSAKKNIFKSKDIFKKYGIIKPYLLYVGNAYPHKNLEKLVEVFDKFKENNPEFNLVLVGGKDYFYRRLEKKVQKFLKRGVIFSGFVNDGDMDSVYQQSELVVFPSLYEGFGFPPLEALLNGKRVACSNQTSMPEILGKNVEYFNPKINKSMLNCIKKALKNKKSKNKIDLNQIREKFNWLITAKETLKIYESVKK